MILKNLLSEVRELPRKMPWIWMELREVPLGARDRLEYTKTGIGCQENFKEIRKRN